MANKDPDINEKLADEIQQSWLFKLRRLPINILARIGIVQLSLILLECLLIISNNVTYLGYWAAFSETSSHYRDAFNAAVFERTNGRVDFTKIAALHLWRGWVVPTLLAGASYVIPALLCLRHELYRWNPEMLALYLERAGKSSVGRGMPRAWVDRVFHAYEDRHRRYLRDKTQKDREHVALKDAGEFTRVLRVVAGNLAISSMAILCLWIGLLQTRIDQMLTGLPRAFVPPVQGVVWYFINDVLYYYPHRLAHSPMPRDISSGSDVYIAYRIIPRPISRFLHNYFKDSHRLHHRSKANLGIAAWYCSPAEQVFFNLLPALAGPLLTQALASALGVEDIWGTHLATLYVWLMAATTSSVLAHSGHQSIWNNPNKHDLHHERSFDAKGAVNFGTMGVLDKFHGTLSQISLDGRAAWIDDLNRQAALRQASARSGVPLTEGQLIVGEATDKND